MSELLPPDEVSPEEMMFQQAVEFIAQGKYAEARDLFTRLLKSDQNNVEYWVWLSAAMETPKERLYCLQTAYRIDPNHAAARRGLTLLGALPPDETLTPFPMSHPRPWDTKVKLADDAPRPTGFKAIIANPVVRLAAVLLLGAGLIGGVIAGFSLAERLRPEPTRAAIGPTLETVTAIPLATQRENRGNQSPLAGLILTPFTPTPLYAATPHGDLALDSYKGAMRSYNNGQWEMVGIMMAQVATAHPGSPDTLYFIAEAHRLAGRYKEALEAYQDAIKVGPNFAPNYLGRARANMAFNPKKNVLSDLTAAIDLDGNYGEAYMERGLYYLKLGQPDAALDDLRKASILLEGSPLVEIGLARAALDMGDEQEALEAAKRANELDPSMLEGYLVLGMAYRANGMIDDAVEALETYTEYSTENSEAFVFLGAAYFNRGETEKARSALNTAIRLDKTSSQGYFWRAEMLMAEKKYKEAQKDYEQALRYRADWFDAALGIARALIAQEDYNNAYATLDKNQKLLKTDEQKALFWFHRALCLQNIGFPDAARRDWQDLLELPEQAMTPELRAQAEEYLEALKDATPVPPTETPTSTPAAPATTPTKGITPSPSKTPTP